MKKTIAMMLATATTLSVGLTALAADVETMEESSSSSSSSSEESSSSAPESSSSTPESEGGSSAPSSSEGETGAPETPAVDPSAFLFDADPDSGAILGDTILEPGTEYKFPVKLLFGDKAEDLTDAMIKDFKFTYSKLSSNGVSKFEIDEHKGTYYLYVTVRQSTPLKPVDVKYNLKLVRKENNMTVFGQEVKFQYGYDESNNDYINGLDKGDVVEIDNSKPVITGSQFNKIAKINDYKNVTLSGPSWTFEVNVTDETTKNMVSNNAGVKDVLAKFPDQDFKFFSFPGKPSFNGVGRLALDVDDIADDFGSMHVYRYADGKLYAIKATLNKDDNTLEFRTSKLDTFVVTNKEIKDGTIVNEGVLGDSVSRPEDNGSNGSGSEDDKQNPSTGASDMINAAVIAAIASLGAAGAVAAKKFSK